MRAPPCEYSARKRQIGAATTEPRGKVKHAGRVDNTCGYTVGGLVADARQLVGQSGGGGRIGQCRAGRRRRESMYCDYSGNAERGGSVASDFRRRHLAVYRLPDSGGDSGDRARDNRSDNPLGTAHPAVVGAHGTGGQRRLGQSQRSYADYDRMAIEAQLGRSKSRDDYYSREIAVNGY